MTFGIRNVSQTFQMYIHKAIGDQEFVFAYIDDILIASSGPQEHKKHLSRVFERLKDHALRINVSKCEFGKQQLEFLSHIINSQEFTLTPQKVKSVAKFPKPRTIVELRLLLGRVNFYKRSILKHLSMVSCVIPAKMTSKLSHGILRLKQLFEKIKNYIANAALLAHPSSSAETRLITDACGLSGAIEQCFNNTWNPLAFFSQTLSPAEQKYSAYDGELTAVYKGIEYFRTF